MRRLCTIWWTEGKKVCWSENFNLLVWWELPNGEWDGASDEKKKREKNELSSLKTLMFSRFFWPLCSRARLGVMCKRGRISLMALCSLNHLPHSLSPTVSSLFAHSIYGNIPKKHFSLFIEIYHHHHLSDKNTNIKYLAWIRCTHNYRARFNLTMQNKNLNYTHLQINNNKKMQTSSSGFIFLFWKMGVYRNCEEEEENLSLLKKSEG